MRLFSFSIFLLTILTFSACNKTDEVDDIINNPANTNVISAKIDGVDFSVSGIFVSASYSTPGGMIESLAIGGAKPANNSLALGLALGIVSTDGSGINSGETYTATSTSKVAVGEYAYDDDNTLDINASSTNTDVASITITDIDYANKLVSGTFSFDAIDNDDPGTTYEVREGEFTDVSFN